MIKSKKFTTPLFGNKFTLIIYEQAEEIKNFLPDYDFEKNRIEEFDGCVFTHNDEKYITYKRYVDDGIQFPTPGIIAHEAKHLTNNIFISIGHRLDEWNDEPECYMLMWIVNRIHEFLMNEFPKEPVDKDQSDTITRIREYIDVQKKFGRNMGKTVNYVNSKRIVDDILDIINSQKQ